MITAMQMMLNDLISKREVYENASMHHSVATLETSIEIAQFLLEKEKYLGEYIALKTQGVDVHVMNKYSLLRLIDDGK
jgi:hypothetical protein